MEMALRTSNLLLPEGFVEMDCEEMMYVDGGGTISLTLTGGGIIGIIASAFLKMFIRSGISAAIVAANMAVHAPFTALNAAFGGYINAFTSNIYYCCNTNNWDADIKSFSRIIK